MLESIDEGVGNIVNILQKLKIDQNTLIIFTSDNGGETKVTSNSPLRGGKSQLYEGGIRVPFIAYWPGKIKKGTTSNVPINTLDIFPTLTSVAGLAELNDKQYDGSDISPLLSGKSAIKARNLYWYYPLAKPHFLGGRSSGAIRNGDYKLIEFFDDNSVELYNMREDVSETNNLASKETEKTAELKALLKSWRADLNLNNVLCLIFSILWLGARE